MYLPRYAWYSRWSFILQRNEMKLNFRFLTKWIRIQSLRQGIIIIFLLCKFNAYIFIFTSNIHFFCVFPFYVLEFEICRGITAHSFESPDWNVNIQGWFLLYQILIYETCFSIVMRNLWHNLQLVEGGEYLEEVGVWGS